MTDMDGGYPDIIATDIGSAVITIGTEDGFTAVVFSKPEPYPHSAFGNEGGSFASFWGKMRVIFPHNEAEI